MARGVADDALRVIAHMLGRDGIRVREGEEVRRHRRGEPHGAEINGVEARIALVDVADDQVGLAVEQALAGTGDRREMEMKPLRSATHARLPARNPSPFPLPQEQGKKREWHQDRSVGSAGDVLPEFLA